MAVIVAEPAARALINPEEFTPTTAELLEVQLTPLLLAFAGAIVAAICPVCPGARFRLVRETEIPVTGTELETPEYW